jgi:hypothetical protein
VLLLLCAALGHGAGVNGSHGDLEGGREVGDSGDGDVAAGDLESVDSHGKKSHIGCDVYGGVVGGRGCM